MVQTYHGQETHSPTLSVDSGFARAVNDSMPVPFGEPERQGIVENVVLVLHPAAEAGDLPRGVGDRAAHACFVELRPYTAHSGVGAHTEYREAQALCTRNGQRC